MDIKKKVAIKHQNEEDKEENLVENHVKNIFSKFQIFYYNFTLKSQQKNEPIKTSHTTHQKSKMTQLSFKLCAIVNYFICKSINIYCHTNSLLLPFYYYATIDNLIQPQIICLYNIKCINRYLFGIKCRVSSIHIYFLLLLSCVNATIAIGVKGITSWFCFAKICLYLSPQFFCCFYAQCIWWHCKPIDLLFAI